MRQAWRACRPERTRRRSLALTTLIALHAAITLNYQLHVWRWWQDRTRGSPAGTDPIDMAIGFITDFLDTLGIGSFATTTAFKQL